MEPSGGENSAERGESMTDHVDTVLGVAITVILLCVSVGLTADYHEQKFRKEAVTAGHAEYYFDADFQKQWRWKTNCAAALKGELK